MPTAEITVEQVLALAKHLNLSEKLILISDLAKGIENTLRANEPIQSPHSSPDRQPTDLGLVPPAEDV